MIAITFPTPIARAFRVRARTKGIPRLGAIHGRADLARRREPPVMAYPRIGMSSRPHRTL